MDELYEHVKNRSDVGRLINANLLDDTWKQEYDEETAWLNSLPRHEETIRCPKCEHVQVAEILHSQPFAMFVHNCERCEYIIMESEWDRVEVQP